MNHIRNNILIILLSYLIIGVLAFLIYPLMAEINHMDLIKEGFFYYIYILPIYTFMLNTGSVFVNAESFSFEYSLLSLLIVLGNIIPIILILKRKKAFPFIIILIVSFFMYVFMGILLFGIRKAGA